MNHTWQRRVSVWIQTLTIGKILFEASTITEQMCATAKAELQHSTEQMCATAKVELQHSKDQMCATVKAELQHSTDQMCATAKVELQHSTEQMCATAKVELQHSTPTAMPMFVSTQDRPWTLGGIDLQLIM
jgi:plasmid stability protein